MKNFKLEKEEETPKQIVRLIENRESIDLEIGGETIARIWDSSKNFVVFRRNIEDAGLSLDRSYI